MTQTKLQPILDNAWQLHQSGNLDAAEAIYRQVLQQVPKNAAAHVYLGIAQFDRRQFSESVASYRTAIRLQPNFPIAWNNLGNSLRMLGEIEASDRALQTATDQKPDYLSPLKNRGTLWIWAGEVEKGLGYYRDALRIAPHDPELHRNLGVIYLLQQRYDEGWPEYRARWTFMPDGHPQYPFPLWQGEDPIHKTFLLYPEQGLGDAVQFVRVVALLKAAGARTIVVLAPNLIPLFSSIPAIDSLVPEGMAIHERIDYHASFLDVVDYWYGRTGTLATAHEQLNLQSGYLSVSPTLVDYWSRTLGEKQKRRIGICWQGNPQHHADIYRSIKLSEFERIAALPDLELVSLQRNFGCEQLMSCSFASSIRKLPENIDQSGGAFLDTAAIMKNLDLVITSDTSTAHVAGALGVPVWVLLGKVPDWRWWMQGDKTPWYPTMRLFRQQKIGDWTTVFDEVRDSLKLV